MFRNQQTKHVSMNVLFVDVLHFGPQLPSLTKRPGKCFRESEKKSSSHSKYEWVRMGENVPLDRTGDSLT